MEDLWHDPQLWARHAIVELDSPDFGSHYYGECPHRMSVTPGAARWPCLRLGQHTTEILQDWLGLDVGALQPYLAVDAVYQA